MNNGFVRIAAAVPQLKVADCKYNLLKIIELIEQAESKNAQVVCFPELCLTGYTCADLFFQNKLLTDAENALYEVLDKTADYNLVVILGMHLRTNNKIYNAAVVIQGGRILGIVPKTFLPNSGEYYEKRWFSPAETELSNISILDDYIPFGTNILFSDGKFSFAVEICEDLWMPIPPSSQHTMHGAEIIFNLSASNELVGKSAYRSQLIEQQSARCISGYVYAAAGAGESTTDMVFSGVTTIAENGKTLSRSKSFLNESQLVVNEIDIERLQTDRRKNSNFETAKSDNNYLTVLFQTAEIADFKLNRKIEKHPFVPQGEQRGENCEDVFAIQTAGLAKRWEHTRANTMVLGISGGLDSTLALLVCVKTADLLNYDRKRIIGVTMPGFGTTNRTYSNAIELMSALGITAKEISIKDACIQHFKDIEHDISVHDTVFENVQARERTQILMDIANKENGLVAGTGDLSELALGWATYNGDHMSMYGINCGVPKTLVRYLVSWIANTMDKKTREILNDILNTPVSPELLPADENGKIAQRTEDLVGPYELHDFFLYYFVRFGFSPEKIFFLAKNAFQEDYSEEITKKWLKTFLRRFFSQQFKRSCVPDGPKVGSISLSPRGDWRMPSDAVAFDFD